MVISVTHSGAGAAARPPTAKDIDDDLPNYFGVMMHNVTHPGYTFHRNHVFDHAQ
jgi:hypothetical protein